MPDHQASAAAPGIDLLDRIREEGRAFTSVEFARLGELSREARHCEVVRAVTKYAQKVLPYDNYALWELDKEEEELIPLFSRGYDRRLCDYRLRPGRFGNGITGFVALEGIPYIARDLVHDPHYLPGLPGARSSVTVPFKVAAEIYGVVNVEAVQTAAFGPADVDLLREFAVFVAVALNIRRLLDMGEEITVKRIATTMAHEINNPLAALFLTLDDIRERHTKLPAGMSDALRGMGQSLTLIQSAVARMVDLRRPTVDDRYGTIALEKPLDGRRILVIEDDGDIRARLAECLGRERCIVETAADGAEGLRMALAGPYDIVFTDIKMPGMSGFEVFDRIRKAKPGQKIIMMTAFGYDEGHAIVRGNQHGLNGVLYKPFTPELLRKVLARVCQ